MYPRGLPDLSWGDLALLLWFAVRGGRRGAETLCPSPVVAAGSRAETICLSVRTGLDLVLQDLALEPGSEVLVSAVTIADMVRILEAHQLIVIPIDVDPANLGCDIDEMVAAIGPKTKAILVAHLFGSRMNLDSVAALATEHQLVLIEDCAQAFDGWQYRGDDRCDVSLFSFGPIKTATALGGAVVVTDLARVRRLTAIESTYAVQPRKSLLRRGALFGVLKIIARPQLYSLFIAICRWCGTNHDKMIASSTRGFRGDHLITQLRRRPTPAVRRMIHRRMVQSHDRRITARAEYANRVLAYLPQDVCPGAIAGHHTHWVLPIISRDPPGLIDLLAAHGFDSTCRGSSLFCVASSENYPRHVAGKAQAWLPRLVYLPIYPQMRIDDSHRLGKLVQQFEASE